MAEITPSGVSWCRSDVLRMLYHGGVFLTAPDFQSRLIHWYCENRRDLPWRAPLETGTRRSADARPSPYAVLVSEAMLQQTQVATVIPYFNRWMKRFPTLESLATALEQEVLTEWAGLGYYARARNLLKAAKAIVFDLRGVWPTTAQELRELPGIGPYTAGAIASIAFNRAEPIVDGNVQRVVARLWAYPPPASAGERDMTGFDLRSRQGVEWTWERSAELIEGVHDHVPPLDAGDFNSALMELGATICTPRSPKCLLCPVAQGCRARQLGLQEKIPPPKVAKVTPEVERWAYLLCRSDGAVLLEQRPATGRWASMWQVITREAPLDIADLKEHEDVRHALTHRRYTFHVFSARVAGSFEPPPASPPRPHQWVHPRDLKGYPIPRPQQKILGQLSPHPLH